MSEIDPDFRDIQAACRHRVKSSAPGRYAGTMLRMEWIDPTSGRCLRQSPDGYGLRWWISGGEIEAYGPCVPSRCPLLVGGSDPEPPEPTGPVIAAEDFFGSPAQVLDEGGVWRTGKMAGLYPDGSVLIDIGQRNVFVRAVDVETHVRWPLAVQS